MGLVLRLAWEEPPAQCGVLGLLAHIVGSNKLSHMGEPVLGLANQGQHSIQHPIGKTPKMVGKI